MAIDPEALGMNETPKRRDRNVRQPGQRGGKWRRIWSPKLQKWYIKYGEDPKGAGGISEEGDAAKDDTPPRINVPSGSVSSDTVSMRENEERELLEGIFKKLMESMQIGSTGSGKTRLGRPVSFPGVSPIKGEIAPENGDTNFKMFDEDGEQLGTMTRDIHQEQKRREFMAYMVADYVTNEYLKTKYKKSLTFYVKQNSLLSEELYKARKLAILEGVSTLRVPEAAPTKVDPLQTRLDTLLKAAYLLDESLASGHSLDTDYDSLPRFEKANKREVWLKNAPVAGKRYGHVGSGNKSVYRRPGRPPGTGQGLTMASAGMPRSGIGGLGSEQKTDGPSSNAAVKVKVSDEDWFRNPEVKIGAMIMVQHPYKHRKPTWGRIISMGEHGALVDCDGDRVIVRWEHVHKLIPRVDDTPENVFEIAKLNIPMQDAKKIDFRDEAEAEKQLRKLNMPFAADLIHHGHGDRDDAYGELFGMDAPIDLIEATRYDHTKDGKEIDKFKSNLIHAAMARKVPVNQALLEKLPIEKVVSILNHHLNETTKD